MSPNMIAVPGTKEFRIQLASLRKSYGDAIHAFRRPLYNYCLSLTGDPIEAEDLNQETLLRCFARLSEIWDGLTNLKSYHYRTATNIWTNRIKRREALLIEDVDQFAGTQSPKIDEQDIRDLAILVAATLAPAERAAFMLKDVFDFSLEETASMLDSSVGSVKSALNRARAKILEAREAKAKGSKRKLRASRAIVDSLVSALNQRDVGEALKLFDQEAIGEVVGCGYEIGLDALRDGSLGVNTSYKEFVRAQRFEWRDELFIALWAKEDSATEAVPNAILSIVERNSKIVEIRTYYYTPFTLEEIANESGVPFKPIGRFPFQDQ